MDGKQDRIGAMAGTLLVGIDRQRERERGGGGNQPKHKSSLSIKTPYIR